MYGDELEQYAHENFSSFEGDVLPVYTGEGDDFVDFGGPNRSFAVENSTQRIFVVVINNGLDTVERVKLMPGITWKPGDVGDNVLADGVIKTVGSNTLSAQGSPKSIKEFLAFIHKVPTNVIGIRVSHSTDVSQIEQQIVRKEDSPFRDLESGIINLGAYTNEYAYKEKMVSVPTPGLIISAETQLVLPVMPGICTVTFFCGGVLSISSALRNKRDRAAANIASVGLDKVQLQHQINASPSASFAKMVRPMPIAEAPQVAQGRREVFTPQVTQGRRR